MASLVINGEMVEVVGDGMAPGTEDGVFKRDTRCNFCFGSFGYITLVGDPLTDDQLELAADVLSIMHPDNTDFDADELSQE